MAQRYYNGILLHSGASYQRKLVILNNTNGFPGLVGRFEANSIARQEKLTNCGTKTADVLTNFLAGKP